MPIDGLIQQQQFELIRERIGEILALEFSNQYILSSGTTPNATVYLERFINFDVSELPAININLIKGDYSNKDQRQADGEYIFDIDCFSKAKQTDSNRGDYLSSVECQRMVGMVRAILANPIYNTLSFDKPSLCRTEVMGIMIKDPVDTNEGTFQTRGTVRFKVRVPETALITNIGYVISEHVTTINLGDTQLGYTLAYIRLHEGVYDVGYE